MFFRKTLEDNLIGVSDIDGMIDAFESMCRERSGLFDDLLYLESGNYSYSGKSEYYISLVRQYKDSAFLDDYTALRLDIIYPEIKINFKNRKILKNHFSADHYGGSYTKFFEKVRDSKLIAYVKENRLAYIRYEISEEEI